MKHPGEEQLVLHRYGDAEDAAEIERHLAACEACRKEFEALGGVLATVDSAAVPEPPGGAHFEARVWHRLEPHLDAKPGYDWRAWLLPSRLALAGGVAVLLLAAFLAGRFWPRPEEDVISAEQVRERILLVAVGDHLERSKMVLVELVNAPANGAVNIAPEQRRAEDLVAANRLYRQTAESAGEAGVAEVLEELERILLEIARSPQEISSAELASLQRRIETRGILFKVRVVGSEVREREKSAAPVPVASPARGRS